MSDTPESNKAKIAFTSLFANDDAYWVPFKVSCKLERERDEARETAERYRLEANAMMMQRDMLVEEQNLLKQCLSAMPVGYIPTHTAENLPEMICDLAKALAEETAERENLERELATVTEQRDRMIYALFMCRRELVDVLDDINKERVSYDGDDFHEALRISKEALAAVKGENNE
jgi:hypothetical protein